MKRNLLLLILFLCSVAMQVASAQTVVLDYYFNHESHVAADGQVKRFHYMWDDTTNTGFSKWGNEFKAQGATLSYLATKPTIANLKRAAIYIIVDPDTKKENPAPNYIQKDNISEIANWVKTGGVLVLMANDSANVELKHFNMLASRFGMHFNNDMQNLVLDDAHFEDGAVPINNNPVFKTAKKAFMKDVCSISLSGKAQPILKAANGAVIAATATHGEGTIFAVSDPWLYNEYVNGRLPTGFDNDNAMSDITRYLLLKAKKH